LTETLAQGHRDNRLLAALPSAALAAMDSELRQISIAQGVLIYEPGDAVEDVYFPQTAMISLLVVTKDVGSVEASTVGREGALGLIARYTEVLWAEAQQIAACNATHDAASRLTRWLLQCADRTGSDKLALTQDFLAQMLNVRRTTVTLLAQALQRKGLIKYSRGQIAVLSRAGLEQQACECHHVLHHDKLPQTIGVKL